MKRLLTLLSLAGLLIVANVAHAGFDCTVDGVIDEWEAAYIHTDDPTDKPADGCVEVVNWGFYYQSQTATDPGYMFWFCEIDTTIYGKYDENGTPEGTMYPGLWIDTDHYSGPITYTWGAYAIKDNGLSEYWSVYAAPSAGQIADDWVGPEWQNAPSGAELRGIDIEPELGLNDEGYNYWGYWDVMSAQGNPITGTSYAYTTTGKIIEAQVPIDDMIEELKTYPDYVNSNFKNISPNGLWKLALRAAGNHSSLHLWGVDVTWPIYFTIFADANNDGVCNILDFQKIQTNYGGTGKVWETGDYDLDGDCDLFDFQFLQVTYGMDIDSLGPTGAGSAVPEPVTLVLLGLGGLLLRRRK
jgi:hypothetical protein